MTHTALRQRISCDLVSHDFQGVVHEHVREEEEAQKVQAESTRAVLLMWN